MDMFDDFVTLSDFKLQLRKFRQLNKPCRTGLDWPMGHCARAHGPPLRYQIGP